MKTKIFKNIFPRIQNVLKRKSKIDKFPYEYIFLGIVLLLMAIILSPALTNDVIAGWDTTGHFYLFTKMLDLVRHGSVNGYDANWLSGYPAFTFYGPFSYIVMSLIYYISFGLLTPEFVFNLFLFLVPLILISSIFYFCKTYFNKLTAVISLFITPIFFAIPDIGRDGFGLQAIFQTGLFISIIGISLMFFFFSFAKKAIDKKSLLYTTLAGFFLGFIVINHILTAIFSFIIIFFFVINYLKEYKKLLQIAVIGFVVSSWWTIPFLLNLSFSAGSSTKGNSVVHQLYKMFPGVQKTAESFPPESLWAFIISFAPALLIVIGLLVGIIFCIRRRYFFLPIAFILTAIFLPRSFLYEYTPFPLHYYRFTAYIFLLQVPLVAIGLEKIMSFRLKKKGASRIKNIIVIPIIILLLGIVTYSYSYKNLLHNPSNQINTFNNFARSTKAFEMIDYIKNKNIENRVAIEINPLIDKPIGSPHIFTSLIPITTNTPIANGLLAESSLSHNLISSALLKLTNYLPWGDVSIYTEYFLDNDDQSLDSMVERLTLFNIEYILTVSYKAYRNLSELENVELDKEIEPFSLYKIKNTKPFIRVPSYAPYLYINKGDIGFKTIMNDWYVEEEFFEIPIITTDKNIKKIPQKELNQMSGIIIAMPENTNITDEILEEWKKYNSTLIFMDSKENLDKYKNELRDNSKKISTLQKITPVKREDEYLSFYSDMPSIISYSYFPKWKSKNKTQTVYWSTPNLIFIFGEGLNEIYYD